MPATQISRVLDHLRQSLFRQGGAGLNDRELLECFVGRRDEAAFEAIVRRHGPMVMGVCRRVLRNGHDAEDAFQATFLVLVRKAGSIASRDLLANWLYGVAYHTSLKARVAAAKHRAREMQVTEMPEPEALPEPSWTDLRPLLDRELSRLPEKYRVPIVLCDLEGKGHKEAARQLGWPQGTVSGRLSRGRVLLAKRLARHGPALSAGSLILLLSESGASAWVPASLVVSTVKAAGLTAAGQAAAGVVSAQVAALVEGVSHAMLLSKLKIAAAGVFVVLLAALGTGTLSYRLLAQRPGGDARTADAGAGRRRAPSDLAGKVVAVAADGKAFTLEIAAPNRGEEAKKLEIKLDDKTMTSFTSVGPDGARVVEGLLAQVWLAEGSKDVASRLALTGHAPDIFRRGPDLSGRVARVSADGKVITFLFSERGRGEQRVEAKTVDVRITDTTTVVYSHIAGGGAKPAEGYMAEVWLESGSTDAADRVNLSGSEGVVQRGVFEPDPSHAGKVVAVSADGKSFTVEVPAKNRGEAAGKVEIKLDDKTKVSYHNVGPGGDKPAEGHSARVWLAEGSKDTAAKVSFLGTVKDKHAILEGAVVGVAADGRGITLEVPPGRDRNEKPAKRDVKLTDKTNVIYHGVGPGGARLTEGYVAQVALEIGSTDTAAQVRLSFRPARRADERRPEPGRGDPAPADPGRRRPEADPAGAGRRPENPADARRREGRIAADLQGKITALSEDGKTLTLEHGGRGEEPKKTEVKLTAQTRVAFAGILKDMAGKLKVGDWAAVRLQEGSKDTAAEVQASRGPDLAGKIAAVSADGRALTLEIRSRVSGEQDEGLTRIDIKLSDKTKTEFPRGEGDGKLTTDYLASVWLQEGSRDTAAAVQAYRPRPDLGGEITAVSDDGKVLTLEARGRNGEVTKTEVRLTDKTRIEFPGVDKAEDRKLEAGCGASVWLQEGSRDTAGVVQAVTPAQLITQKRGPDVTGTITAVGLGFKVITLESRNRGEEQATKTEIKIGDKTRILFTGVGKEEEKILTVGDGAAVWLVEGSKDTAAVFRATRPGARAR